MRELRAACWYRLRLDISVFRFVSVVELVELVVILVL